MAPSGGSDAWFFDVHHDGVFKFKPLRYEDGLVYQWKVYKNKKLDYKSMCGFLKEETDHAGINAFYFCLPECSLEVGLKVIERDIDVAAMYEFAESYGKIDMFLTHRHQNLAPFYFKNLSMEESGDEATSRIRIHEIMSKDASNMSLDELVSWAEEDAATRTPRKKVGSDESPVVKRKLLGRKSPITKRNLSSQMSSPTSYVVNKGKAVVNEESNKGDDSPHKGSDTVKKVVEKGTSVGQDSNKGGDFVYEGDDSFYDGANSLSEGSDTVKKAVEKRKSMEKQKGKRVMEQKKVRVRRPVSKNKGIVIQENVRRQESESDSASDSGSDGGRQESGSDGGRQESGSDGGGFTDSLYDDTDNDSVYSDKSIDYLSEGEEELIELRKRKSEAKKKPKVRSQQSAPANEGTSSGVSQKRNPIVGDNETVLQHEGFMDDLMRKLKQDDGLIDPFHIVETKVEKYPIHDVDTHWRMRKPKVSEKFVDAEQLKECLTYYALANGFSLWFYRSSSTKVIAKCGLRPETLTNPELGKRSKFKRYPSEADRSKCKWRCYGRKMTNENSFQVISMVDEHTCVRQFKYGTLVSYKWIGRHFGQKIRLNPDIKLHEIADLVLKKYKCIVTPNQCRNAKRWALNEGETNMEEHYGYIRSYAKAILDSNPGSTCKVGVTVNEDDKTYFDRFYVCFKGLKEGWKLGCRKIIALDGCFLKKPSQGEILTAIGRDANNHIYPVAWAVVNVENKENWRWFLDLLGDDIDMPTGNGLTLMSDQHKGLIEAVKEVMPHAEHRQCARHIYENFRKQYSGLEFRLLFWSASKASFPGMFNKIMERIKKANPNAYDYLLKKDPKTWSRAYFHIGPNCEAIENGFSECFNSVILSVRNKPLITMLEAMRVIVLERMHIMRNLCEKWNGDICPNIQKRLEATKDQHRYWHVISTGGGLFEVRNGSQAYGVDEQRRTCSCRMWQLSGLPCCHAIAVIFKLGRMVEEYVPACFRKQAFHDAYHQYLAPVGGMSFWPDCNDMSRVLPPKLKTMPGRPRKKRIRAPHENKNTNKVSKAGVTMTCSNCQQKGHNKKGCTNPTVVLPPKPPAKKGRPRKNPLVGTSLVDEDIGMEQHRVVDEQQTEGYISDYDINLGEGSSQGRGVGGSTLGVRVSTQANVDEQPTVDEQPEGCGVRVSTQAEGIVGSNQPNVEQRRNADGLGGSNQPTVDEQPRNEPGIGGSSQEQLGRGKRVKKTTRGYKRSSVSAARFGKLGRWFGLGQSDDESGPIDKSESGQHATQTSRNFSKSAFTSSQASPTPQEQVGGHAEQESRAGGVMSFIKPRQRSERILKRKLAKQVTGIGSTSSTALDLD